MASRLTTFIVVLIVAGTLIAGPHRRRAARRRERTGRSHRHQRPRVHRQRLQIRRGRRHPRQQDPPRRHQSRNQAPAAAADDDGRRARRLGAARLQRCARAPDERRPCAVEAEPARCDDARGHPVGGEAIRGRASRAPVDSRGAAGTTTRFRAGCRRASSSMPPCRTGRRTWLPTMATPAGRTRRRSRLPASRAARRTPARRHREGSADRRTDRGAQGSGAVADAEGPAAAHEGGPAERAARPSATHNAWGSPACRTPADRRTTSRCSTSCAPRASCRCACTPRCRSAPAHATPRCRRLEAARQKYRDDPLLKVGAVKLMADGVIESHTALMLAPYANKATTGTPNFSPDELERVVGAPRQGGWQVESTRSATAQSGCRSTRSSTPPR